MLTSLLSLSLSLSLSLPLQDFQRAYFVCSSIYHVLFVFPIVTLRYVTLRYVTFAVKANPPQEDKRKRETWLMMALGAAMSRLTLHLTLAKNVPSLLRGSSLCTPLHS
jgi:hypothetical protein